MNWQDRWIAPLAAMVIAAILIYVYVLDGLANPAVGHFSPIAVSTPFAVYVHPKLRDPFMLANEWDALLVGRDKLIRERQSAAEAARDEEELDRLEREDIEYFKRHGKHLTYGRRRKVAAPTSNTTVTARARPAGLPQLPPLPVFRVGGVLVGGAQRTAVVNDKVVTTGDTVQGFRVAQLSITSLELVGTVDPWKGKRLTLDISPPPSGVTYVKERPR